MTDPGACPSCRATKYTNPMLKLLVNVCGHSLCENCVEVMFVRGSGACPVCGTPLRRVNFRMQLFEDSSVEKEMRIRKKIIKDFNKEESDFDSLSEYNDYLEMVEKIIFNLVNNENVEETKRLIERYKKENNDEIKRNRVKKSRDIAYLTQLIEDEQSVKSQLNREDNEEKELLRNQKQNKEKMIDELISSEGSASAIVQQHVDATVSTLRARDTNMDVVQISTHQIRNPVAEEVFVYRPFMLPLLGPAVDTDHVLKSVTEERERQLGPDGLSNYHSDWTPRLEKFRLLQIAHSGLFIGLDDPISGDA